MSTQSTQPPEPSAQPDSDNPSQIPPPPPPPLPPTSLPSDPSSSQAQLHEERKRPPPSAQLGIRAQRLHVVFERSLGEAIKRCSYENFAACFPVTAERQPMVLRAMYEQIVLDFWQKNARREFSKILHSRNMITALNKFDELLKEAEYRKASAPPGENPISFTTLPTNTLVGAYLTPMVNETIEVIQRKLDDENKRSRALMSHVIAQREEMEALQKKIEGAWEDVKAVVDVVSTAAVKMEEREKGMIAEDGNTMEE